MPEGRVLLHGPPRHDLNSRGGKSHPATPEDIHLPRFLVQPPQSVEAAYLKAVVGAQSMLSTRQFTEAEDLYETGYRILKDRQPNGRRFHKGLPLNQLGIFKLAQRRFREAAKFFMLAFVRTHSAGATSSQDLWMQVVFRLRET